MEFKKGCNVVLPDYQLDSPSVVLVRNKIVLKDINRRPFIRL